MVLIYVIYALISFVIYTVIKVKIEEWHREIRMNRLSLKRSHQKNVHLRCNTPPSMQNPEEVIEISDDETDISWNVIDSDGESALPSTKNKCYDEETSLKFQVSTDSIETDEDVGKPIFNSNLRPTTSMFNWNQYSANLDTNKSKESNESEYVDECHIETKVEVKKDIQSDHERDRESKGSTPIADNIGKVDNKGSKDNCVPEVKIQHERMISGVRVKLPVKPYPSQVAVINKLIQGCIKQENCLLESPTGSGKTLALLCGILSWHDHYIAEIQKKIDAAKFNGEMCGANEGADKDFLNDKELMIESDEFVEYDNVFQENLQKFKIPKIFYGTRTHKQIEQVVKELRTTCYTHKKMTILSSREHTCIQETTKNKNDLCNELLDPTKHKGGCPYYNESNKRTLSTFWAAKRRGLPNIWDIEDLVSIGKAEGSCPYFAARSLADHAEIIFCPYNYIIDPDIRESIQLDVKDHVIILDEAHNIEDACRDIASVNFRDDCLIAAATECESLAKQRAADLPTFEILKTYILKLANFLKTFILNNTDSYNGDQSSTYWTGPELVELFNMNELGEPSCSRFLNASNTAIEDSNKEREEIKRNSQVQPTRPEISRSTKTLLKHMMFAMRMITSETFANDYRGCIVESDVKDFKHAQDNTWYSIDQSKHRARTLKLICMNPAVVFLPLAQSARCVILASGTLSPMLSFQSELGTSFTHTLNTGHVIPKEQVYTTCIPRGPTGVNLKANYHNVNSWTFQDELGRVLLDVCESVPHGILCFFSSYTMMQKQVERWKNTFIWQKITSVKVVFSEPKYGGDLAEIMYNYRRLIKDTSMEQIGNINGALLLAVFRGKIAEGIDFKDDEARCVITVGIPYAIKNDPVIDMKMKYNNMNSKKGLLNGSDWYTIQAFRALNQALGRCLRHIHDWGAVLLVDERLLMSENREKLPKWVKTMWTYSNNYNLRKNLQTFVARQKERDQKNNQVPKLNH